jgi:hypothetical protein
MIRKLNSANYKKIVIICPHGKDENQLYDIFIIEKKNSAVEIVKKYTRLIDVKEVSQAIKSYPTFLCLSGDALIERIITTADQDNYTNFNENDFIKFQVEMPGERLFLALLKRNTLDQYLASMSSVGITILGLQFSVTGIIKYNNFLGDDVDAFEINGKSYLLENKDITEIRRSTATDEFSFQYYGEKRDVYEVLALTSALDYFLNGISVFSTTQTLAAELRRFNFRYHLKRAMLFLLFFLFTMLCVNMVTDYYLDIKLTKIVNQVKQKEAYLAYTNKQLEKNKTYNYIKSTYKLQKNYPLSYLVNETAYYLDGSLMINSIDVNPLKKKIKSNEVILFNNSVVDIKGEVIHQDRLSDFFDKMDEVSWVKQLNKMDYSWSQDRKRVEIWMQILVNE